MDNNFEYIEDLLNRLNEKDIGTGIRDSVLRGYKSKIESEKKELVKYISDKNHIFLAYIIGKRLSIDCSEIIKNRLESGENISEKTIADIICFAFGRENNDILSSLPKNKHGEPSLKPSHNRMVILIKYFVENSKYDVIYSILLFLYKVFDKEWNYILLEKLSGLSNSKILDKGNEDKFFSLFNYVIDNGDYYYAYHLFDLYSPSLSFTGLDNYFDHIDINDEKKYLSLFLLLEIVLQKSGNEKEDLKSYREKVETFINERESDKDYFEIYYKLLDACLSVRYDFDYAKEIINRDMAKRIYLYADFSECPELARYIENAMASLFMEHPEYAFDFLEFIEPYNNWIFDPNNNTYPHIATGQFDKDVILGAIKKSIPEYKLSYNDLIYTYMNSILRDLIPLTDFLDNIIDTERTVDIKGEKKIINDYDGIAKYFSGYYFVGELKEIITDDKENKSYRYKLNNIKYEVVLPEFHEIKDKDKGSKEVFYIQRRDKAFTDGNRPFFAIEKNINPDNFIPLSEYRRILQEMLVEGNKSEEGLKSKQFMNVLSENTRFALNINILDILMRTKNIDDLNRIISLISYTAKRQKNNYFWNSLVSEPPHMYGEKNPVEYEIIKEKYDSLKKIKGCSQDNNWRTTIYLNSILRGGVLLSDILKDFGITYNDVNECLKGFFFKALIVKNPGKLKKDNCSVYRPPFLTTINDDQYYVKKSDDYMGEDLPKKAYYMIYDYDEEDNIIWLKSLEKRIWELCDEPKDYNDIVKSVKLKSDYHIDKIIKGFTTTLEFNKETNMISRKNNEYRDE